MPPASKLGPLPFSRFPLLVISCCFTTLFFIFIFLNLSIYLFICLWLRWVFVSVRGLSLVAASGGHSSSRCVGLSLSRPLLLRSTGSRRAGSVVVAHGPSCSAACGMWDLPRPGLEPVSPALAGRLSTTAPPGKPCFTTLNSSASASLFFTAHSNSIRKSRWLDLQSIFRIQYFSAIVAAILVQATINFLPWISAMDSQPFPCFCSEYQAKQCFTV